MKKKTKQPLSFTHRVRRRFFTKIKKYNEKNSNELPINTIQNLYDQTLKNIYREDALRKKQEGANN